MSPPRCGTRGPVPRPGHGARILPQAVATALAACALLSSACSAPAPACDVQRIGRAFADRESDVWVEGCGTVVRILADDLEGARHQRFIVRLDGGQTLLFAHNVDLAPRAAVEVGGTLRFRGIYEWNVRGGVVHWTHHDPRGSLTGGWLEIDGRRYR